MTAVAAPLVQVRGLVKTYAARAGLFRRRSADFRAVDRVSFDIAPGETLGLVGESGSGKSSIGRALTMLAPPTAGSVRFEGIELTRLSHAELRTLRRRFQIVFQDPYASLNPRMRIGEFIAEPLIVHGLAPERDQRREQVAELLRRVGLEPEFADRYPHQFSGGQRQRVCIARAIALQPKFIVADEPISALDVSIQAQVVNLFKDLQEDLSLTYLFISHDLSMVRYICHRVAVLYRGRIVEMGSTEAIFEDARHPYTRTLLSAIPVPDPKAERGRRHQAMSEQPEGADETVLGEVAPGHWVAGAVR